jgi:hypothetical protein
VCFVCVRLVYMCVYVCICVYMCMYMCMCVCVCVRAHVRVVCLIAEFEGAKSVDGCESEGLVGVSTLQQCKKACGSLGGNFSAGSWINSPHCFYVVSGSFTGNCHWNLEAFGTADFYSRLNRQVCQKRKKREERGNGVRWFELS